MSTIQIPSYEELEQAVEQAYQTGLSTISCPAPEQSDAPAAPSIRAPKAPTGLGTYEPFLGLS